MRLQKYISSCGITSRRKAEELIRQGQVKVNGKAVTEQGVKVKDGDSVKIGNKRITPAKKIYIVLNKPEKCISAVKDEKGRPTVMDILPDKVKKGLFPVGRLDFNTTGCLILTNDGDWAHKVIHPGFDVEKKYLAKVKGRIPVKAMEKIKKGVLLNGRKIKPVSVYVASSKEANDTAGIIIKEGINHQVKKMLGAAGLSVIRLKRGSVGIINIKGLSRGEWRHLTAEEKSFFSGRRKKPARKKGGQNEKRHEGLQKKNRRNRQ